MKLLRDDVENEADIAIVARKNSEFAPSKATPENWTPNLTPEITVKRKYATNS